MKKRQSKTLSSKAPLSHLAIIMDGNRRWAKQNKLAAHQGHVEGAKNALKIVEAVVSKGIKELSLYTFSIENWNRSKIEVKFLMDGFKNYLPKYIPLFNKLGIKVLVIGTKQRLSNKLIETIDLVEKSTKNNQTLQLNILFNYGGDDDLNFGLSKIKNFKNISLKKLREFIHSANVSDVDLLIRTGGEIRVSNFLPLQLAYSEFYFTKINWPSFGPSELNKALNEYKKRQRRFGGN
jgi:undecaprenyl diphosphate synthase